jgi:hypothetical protein
MPKANVVLFVCQMALILPNAHRRHRAQCLLLDHIRRSCRPHRRAVSVYSAGITILLTLPGVTSFAQVTDIFMPDAADAVRFLQFVGRAVVACLIAVLILFGSSSFSAQNAQAASAAERQATQPTRGDDEVVAKQAGEPVDLNQELAAARERMKVDNDYYANYYKYLNQINEVQLNKFKWQDRASEVTLWLVVIVVLSGLSMCAFQLWIAFKKDDSFTDTTIDISVQSFRVTSSIVGIVILLISVAFLYLFLKEVYDIKMVDINQSGGEQRAATASVPQLPPPDVNVPPTSVSNGTAD